MAGVLRYTVIRHNPETGMAEPLREGTEVPKWATDLVHADDMVRPEPTPEKKTAAKKAVAGK
jgi:hypothetical protein